MGKILEIDLRFTVHPEFAVGISLEASLTLLVFVPCEEFRTVRAAHKQEGG